MPTPPQPSDCPSHTHATLRTGSCPEAVWADFPSRVGARREGGPDSRPATGPPQGSVLRRLVQARDVGHPGQLCEALDLELPHPLAGEADLAADDVEVHRVAACEPVAQLEDASRPR